MKKIRAGDYIILVTKNLRRIFDKHCFLVTKVRSSDYYTVVSLDRTKSYNPSFDSEFTLGAVKLKNIKLAKILYET